MTFASAFRAVRMRRPGLHKSESSGAFWGLSVFLCSPFLSLFELTFSPLVLVINAPAMSTILTPIFDDLVDVDICLLPPQAKNFFRRDVSVLGDLFSALNQILMDFLAMKQLGCNKFGGFLAVSSPDRRLRTIQVDEVFFREAALLVSERHGDSFG